MAIAEGLSATKAGFDLLKGALEMLKREQVDRQEVAAQLLELQGLLIDTRRALVDAEEENRALSAELAENSRVAELEALMVYNKSVYWKKIGNGAVEGEPYCTVCWERDKRLSHLRPGATRGTYRCQACQSAYTTNESR